MNDIQDVQQAVPHKAAEFDQDHAIKELKHYLPAQASLKDFIHHNTLHAFQNLPFHEAARTATELFGYKTLLTLKEYRQLYADKKINDEVLDAVLRQHAPNDADVWKKRMLETPYSKGTLPRIGSLRAYWKKHYRMDIDATTHSLLFRILCSYLDQGISMWHFPVWNKGFLASLEEMEQNSYTSFFRTKRARQLLLEGTHSITQLLKILVGDQRLYTHYLFDQQFAHQGWSGLVSMIEDQPETLLDRRKISLHDLIYFELLLEIDVVDQHFGERWRPLHKVVDEWPADFFAPIPLTEYDHVLTLWQDAMEWSYYDQVLAGIKQRSVHAGKDVADKTFQAMFCIDDREYSLRHYLETEDPNCETFGTPGFFSVEFFFKPQSGKFYTKLCPAPVTPKFLIKEESRKDKHKKDAHFNKVTQTLFRGWLITQTLGLWSALRLFINIFKPRMSPATSSSFNHMDKQSSLTIECNDPQHMENGLQVGFTLPEMVQRVESLLKSIGLVKDFAPIVYVVGHGSSSINNPHYAAYDCGACSGRPGSVNARVICYMANHPEVRTALRDRGIDIPGHVQFVGGLHDTTRDEVAFYDEQSLTPENVGRFQAHEQVFQKALRQNARERARRFYSINPASDLATVYRKVQRRSVSLFEPRPELNHATNALCIVGRRHLTRNLFLDRRAFLNSFDYRVDPEGNYLFNILKAAAPVCGGINLEYFFSRTDNQKLGAGTKLPHNVMGLIGVANGIEGDLRPGLPSQMIEVHDPVRLLMVVEHIPDVVLHTIQRSPETYQWFELEWVHLVVVNPEDNSLHVFHEGGFVPYDPRQKSVPTIDNLVALLEKNRDNLPVFEIA